MSYDPEYQRVRRNLLRKKKKCIRCMSPVEKGRTQCKSCREKNSERRIQWKENNLKEGICGICTRKREDLRWKTCSVCRKKAAIRNKKYRKVKILRSV